MNRSVLIIPGPETVIWWGVHIPFLSMVFGVVGILVGHWMAPVLGAPLPIHRQAAVVIGGILLSLTITMAIGQRPMVGLSWSIGIGFAGITIFQTMGKQATGGVRTLGELMLAKLQAALGRKSDEANGSDKT